VYVGKELSKEEYKRYNEQQKGLIYWRKKNKW